MRSARVCNMFHDIHVSRANQFCSTPYLFFSCKNMLHLFFCSVAVNAILLLLFWQLPTIEGHTILQKKGVSFATRKYYPLLLMSTALTSGVPVNGTLLPNTLTEFSISLTETLQRLDVTVTVRCVSCSKSYT